jgi:uncharacterized membrane protein
MRDTLSLLAGVTAVVAAGLTLLSQAGAADIDEAVAVASIWIALALVGVLRAGVRLTRRLRGPEPSR